MRKLTINQENTLLCLTTEYTQLKDICDKYAVIMAKKGYSPNGNAWKNEVSTCLNSLIKRGKVAYKYRGMYAEKTSYDLRKDNLSLGDVIKCPCCKSKNTYNMHSDGVRVCVDCDSEWAI